MVVLLNAALTLELGGIPPGAGFSALAFAGCTKLFVSRPPVVSLGLRLAELVHRVQVLRPRVRVVVAVQVRRQPPRGVVEACELHDRVDRDLGRHHLLHARELLVHDLGRRPWVDAGELEAHHRAGEQTRVDVHLCRFLEVGGPNLVAVGRPLRAPFRADQELEPGVAGAEERGRAFELRPESLPGQARVGQLQRDRLVPLWAELAVLDGLRVETDLRQHRVDDRLPADVVEGDRLPP